MAREPRIQHSLSAAALAALLGACSATAGRDAAPLNGGAVVCGDGVEPRELNCIRTVEASTLRICRLVADTLVDHDRNLRIIPRLAESFEASADGKTLTFHLRKGVRWHDGKPFTARDVLYTIDQIRSPHSNIAGNLPALFEPLAAVEAPDEFTVVSRFREPYALGYEAWAKTFILPEHLRFAPGEASPADRAPIGTGAFKFVRWDAQDKIVLEANRDYFAGRPHLDRFIVRYVPNSHTLALALKSGDLDITTLTAEETPADDTGLPYRILRYPALSLDAILWNVREPKGLFIDARVRRAMSMALDRRAYVDKILRGHGLPAVSTFFPGMWAHDAALEPLPHDAGGAAALLAAAGWRDRDGDGILDTPSGPASFTLIFSPRAAEHDSLAAIFKDSVKPLGIDVHLESLDHATYLERCRNHGFEAALRRWGLDVDPDPFDFFHSSSYKDGLNYGGYASTDVDRLAEEGRRTMSLEKRTALYHKVEAILREEQPYTFIAHPSSIVGMSRRLQGVEVAPNGVLAWYPAAIGWWISPAEARH